VLLPIEEIPEILQLIFIQNFSDRDDLKKKAAKFDPLKIRGKLVAKWAVHLSKVCLVWTDMTDILLKFAILFVCI
jgi:hypothetical protein